MNDANNQYQEMREAYQGLTARVTDNFTIEDTGCSYMLIHRQLPLTIELPTRLEREATSHVNMMAPLLEEKLLGVSLESAIETLQKFARRRDFLRERGYQSFEHFKPYDEGFEIVYDIPTPSLDELTRIVLDFGAMR